MAGDTRRLSLIEALSRQRSCTSPDRAAKSNDAFSFGGSRAVDQGRSESHMACPNYGRRPNFRFKIRLPLRDMDIRNHGIKSTARSIGDSRCSDGEPFGHKGH
jgi:hypothetical protein